MIDWVEAGRRGETPELPAAGYGWNETPRLNADIVRGVRRESYRGGRGRLARGVARVVATIDALDDTELLEPGVFDWAGKHPVSRWISMNTARQYTTARTFVRAGAEIPVRCAFTHPVISTALASRRSAGRE